MFNPKLKTAVLLVGLTCLLVLSAVQHFQLRQLTTANAALRNQLDQLASLQSTNEHLAGRLSAALEQSQTNQMELARLRGQGVRLRQLEQENTQLKTQRQQMDRQLHEAQLPSASHDQPPLIVATDVTTATAAGFHHITRLGSLELSPGIPATADLGGGTNCVVTPLALPDGNIETEITMSSTNADGTVSEMTTSRVTSRPGQECAISVGNRMIALAVKLKAQ